MSATTNRPTVRQSLSIRLVRAFSPAPRRLPLQPTVEQLRRSLRHATTVGRLAHLITGYPPPAAIHDVLGERAGEARDIARGIAVRRHRNEVLRATARRSGIDALAPLIHVSGEQNLAAQISATRGAVIVFAHMGPLFGVPAALGVLGVPALIINAVASSIRYPAGIEAWSTKSAPHAASLFLKQGADSLAKGHSVIMAVDGLRGETSAEVTLLGRRIHFRRGIAVLRALTGAPVIPVAVTWTDDHGIAFRAWPQLPDQAPEMQRDDRMADTMERLARWLEDCIREHPEDLPVSRLEALTATSLSHLPSASPR